jgi:hypothetical protein
MINQNAVWNSLVFGLSDKKGITYVFFFFFLINQKLSCSKQCFGLSSSQKKVTNNLQMKVIVNKNGF